MSNHICKKSKTSPFKIKKKTFLKKENSVIIFHN